jgi:hypothetical protein
MSCNHQFVYNASVTLYELFVFIEGDEYLMFATSKSDGSVTESKGKTHENIKDPLDQR